MASRKELKKDIDYLIFELVADCYGCIYENPDKDMSGFEAVINDAFHLKENLISRINQYNASPEGKARVFFKSIRVDLVNGLKDGYEKLEKIVG
jgi:hypothetical protein